MRSEYAPSSSRRAEKKSCVLKGQRTEQVRRSAAILPLPGPGGRRQQEISSVFKHVQPLCGHSGVECEVPARHCGWTHFRSCTPCWSRITDPVTATKPQIRRSFPDFAWRSRNSGTRSLRSAACVGVGAPLSLLLRILPKMRKRPGAGTRRRCQSVHGHRTTVGGARRGPRNQGMRPRRDRLSSVHANLTKTETRISTALGSSQ
jgi:hypothetical protein